MERSVPFPLRRKLGLVGIVLFLIIGSFCGIGWRQFLSLQTYSDRLMEESRELELVYKLDTRFKIISLILTDLREGRDDHTDLLDAQITDLLTTLGKMDKGPDRGADPSRAEHQSAELSTTRVMEVSLKTLLERVHLRVSKDVPIEEARISELQGLAESLRVRSEAEAEEAEENLTDVRDHVALVMVSTGALALLGLGGLLFFVLHAIERPLRALQQRTVALGQGDFRPGPEIRNRDEIGELARAFDSMASRVAATQSDLQDRVATKTRELVRAARYADLGVLAAGVAHEINNPLATIATCAEGMQRRLERGTLDRREETEYFRTIVSEAYRARDITQRLLELARPERAPATRVVLATLLAELQRVTKHQLERKSVALEIDAPAGLSVRANAAELLQALVNLVLNARDASPAGTSIRICATSDDGQALIDVDDQGPGVPPELAERIFEPFFTTKPQGEGTGLGLPLVAAIVEGLGGSIVAMRAPEGGARFRIRIPLDDADRKAS